MQRKQIVLAGFLCTVVCLAVTGQGGFAIASASDAQSSLLRHISYRFSIHNPHPEVIPQAELWTYAPCPVTAYQERTKLSASHPFDMLTDEFGNQILHFTFPDFPPYGTKNLRIEADLLLTGQSRPETGGSVEHPGLEFVLPEQYCESEDSGIQELAQALRAETPENTVRNIFEWIVANIRYSGYLKEPRGARYALKHRQGDCTEFMYLFMALCRAAGIPARGLGGYTVSQNSVLTAAAYHNWAEFYLDGEWRLADPQRNVFMQNQTHYLVMRVLGTPSPEHPMQQARRFRVSGNGLDVVMQ